MRVGVERDAVLGVAELRGEIRHRHPTRDLDTRVAVPQIVGMEPGDAPMIGMSSEECPSGSAYLHTVKPRKG
jgi:hypothetical protein